MIINETTQTRLAAEAAAPDRQSPPARAGQATKVAFASGCRALTRQAPRVRLNTLKTINCGDRMRARPDTLWVGLHAATGYPLGVGRCQRVPRLQVPSSG